MKYTLTDDQFNFISEHVIKKFKNLGVDVYIFGSRVKKTNHKYSDLDLLLKCNTTDKESVSKLKSEIEELLEYSNFPFKVDLVLDSDLAASYYNEVNSSAVLWE